MERCYVCNRELIPESAANEEQKKNKWFQSEEHIIPQFCGGQLTSPNLLCRAHNNRFGDALESPFSKEFILPYLIPVKRSRKERIRKFNAQTIDGRPVKIDSKRRVQIKPGYKLTEDKKDIKWLQYPQSKKMDVKGYIRSVLKKEPTIERTYEETLMRYRQIEGSQQFLEFPDYAISSQVTFRSMIKIAVNYALHSKIPRKLLTAPIDCVLDKTASYFPKYVRSIGSFFYMVPCQQPYFPKKNEISNVLFLKGSKSHGFLYCYIELLNTLNFFVMLSDRYSGIDLEFQRITNVKTGKEIVGSKVTLDVDFNPTNYFWSHPYFEDLIQTGFSYRYSRILRILNNATAKV